MKKYDLGIHKLNAIEIGNGFLERKEFASYFHNSFDDCLTEYVKQTIPESIAGEATAEEYVELEDFWEKVINKLKDSAKNAGDGFCPGEVEFDIEISVKAKVHDFGY